MSKHTFVVIASLAVVAAASCSSVERHVHPAAIHATASSPDLSVRYSHIADFVGTDKYGAGGQVVLEVAFRSLEEKHAAGEGMLVGIEDLWAHALQEGLALFNKPDALWGKTTAEETSDMIGQTTIGPWQLTVTNIRKTYGPPYGVKPEMTDAEIYVFCRDRPEVQAKMIIDYIQQSYETFGKRAPYAIQRYFWLEPFVKGEIGQSDDWTRIVVAKPPPGGTWQDLTPAMKADTGFYAKQVLLGTPYTDSGLLFWLYVSGDIAGLRETLRTWRDQKSLVVGDGSASHDALSIEGGHYRLTSEPGNFTVKPEDVIYYESHPEIREAIRKIVREVADENLVR